MMNSSSVNFKSTLGADKTLIFSSYCSSVGVKDGEKVNHLVEVSILNKTARGVSATILFTEAEFVNMVESLLKLHTAITFMKESLKDDGEDVDCAITPDMFEDDDERSSWCNSENNRQD